MYLEGIGAFCGVCEVVGVDVFECCDRCVMFFRKGEYVVYEVFYAAVGITQSGECVGSMAFHSSRETRSLTWRA